MKPEKQLIVGLGSALVDILIHASEDFLARLDAPKGGMVLVEKSRLDEILSQTAAQNIIVPGGSACNTAVGVAQLGGKARFVGKYCPDDLGDFFETELIRHGVEPMLFQCSSPTGRVLSIITPDAQRTMFTYLGASAEMKPAEMRVSCFQNAGIVHIEGYLLFNPDLLLAALQAARQAGALISLDLASYTVVETAKKLLPEIIREYVNILIANEDESLAYTGISNEPQALSLLAENVDLAVLKLGKRGSLIAQGGRIITIAPQGSGPAVDTTGAGDLWASGFLFGLAQGLPLEDCGALASACGFEVCQVVGATIPPEGWGRIRDLLGEIKKSD